MKLNISKLDSKFMRELLLKYSTDPKIELREIAYISCDGVVTVNNQSDGNISIHKNGFIEVSCDWNGYPSIRAEIYIEIFKRLGLVTVETGLINKINVNKTVMKEML